jgi:putative NADH-flavin reductase
VLLDAALVTGHEVRVLVRDPAKVTDRSKNLSVVQGDACQSSDVDPIVAGCEAVLSTLAGFRGPECLSLGTAAITTAIGRHGVPRIVVMQGFHLDRRPPERH